MHVELDGKIALITGAGKRIGRAIALELARHGCDIAVHCRTSGEHAEETAEEIRGLGRRAVVLTADLADLKTVATLPRQAAQALGGLNILVNNAATFKPMSLETFSVARWNETLDVNLTAPMVLAHAAFPFLRAEPRGNIVNLVDVSAERPWPDYLAYCVSKAGLSFLTQMLAKALAPAVHVNAVAPGPAMFPEDFDKAKIKAITRRIPAMRAGSPEDVAMAVRFLVADGSYITGAILAVDGGKSIAW
ncbi:MAG: SDR family oxidoreductase [Phycisphaerae bacterium]|nr:SDR family oxidoreductase [Phycisphaerae bacterium]